MAMHDEQIAPDRDAIKRDLEYMVRRWGELDQPVMFELRAFGEGKKPHHARFDPDWINEAVDWAVSMNGHGLNVYVVRNPVRITATGAAKDTDIVAAFFVWADCDDPASAGNVHRFDGPKWNAAVTTGRTPSTRVHVYWELEEPCINLDAWRQMQIDIAAHFRSDPVVINPSRIMRVGGTVAFPDTKKQAKGYTSEVATIRTEYDDERGAVSFEQMRRVFPKATAQAAHGAGFDIDMGPKPLDRDRAVIQALSGQEWHHAVIRLVASYVSRGLSDGEIHALTDPLTLGGYTVEQTQQEVQVAIEGARRKGWTPATEQTRHTPNFDHSPAPTPSNPEPKAQTWAVQTAHDFTSDFVAPEYVIEGVAQRGRLYTLTAPTGSGKTAVMLYAATAIATGMQFCGLEVEPGDVLFLAGENPDDVRARVIATLEFYGVQSDQCRLHFISGTFNIREDMERLKSEAAKLPNLILIVVDTFAAYFDGEDENSNAQALDFARVVRSLTMIESKPAVIMPAHPVKNATRQNLAPKGGSSLVNEVDGNLTLWNSDGLITMHWQVKHRGPEFEPLMLELKRYECEQIRDRKGRIMPTVLAQPVLTMRATQIARETMTLEDRILLAINDDPGASKATRAAALEVPASRYQRVIQKLAQQKLIRKFRNKWELTKDGQRAVDEISSGETQPPDLE